MKGNPAATILDPASCLALAFPPTPMLRPQPHQAAYRPWVNLGQAVSIPPTHSLYASQKAGPLSGLGSAASTVQTLPFISDPASLGQNTQPTGTTKGRRPPPHRLQTVFSAKSTEGPNKVQGQGSEQRLQQTAPAALRFFLLAQLTHMEGSASWRCYLLVCSCTFRGVLQKVPCLKSTMLHAQNAPHKRHTVPQAKRCTAAVPDDTGMITSS